ncbi:MULTISPECIES: terminase small subunit [unclassified Neptuniibacter]|uniref:terminase small subunit n=1 Tax=unclassified Neptuniibacter TaxID=2630693 RepID=UPI000C6A9D1F|nr:MULTISPECIES: terminase small subunit [unclassified Neptuniibacter]MAY42394.1 DNA packaging protein [Oceanospirillaceae bacterium]
MSLVNKKQLAELFPWSEKSFTAFQKDPSFPIEEKGGRGRENIYDTEKVFAWLLRREMGKSSESPKDRLDRLRGDKEEIVIAKEIEQLVPSEETEKLLAGIATTIRSTMLSGNRSLKADLDSLYDVQIDVGVLNEHSRNILTALSKINKQSECSS